jgi:glyoxylase-like metal-dependent hydrolase (beta-lactamase superfamily II)
MTEPIAFDRTMEFAYGIAAEVAPGVRRLVARNPGPLTFKGTNTYLIGRDEVVVIDAGPDDPMHRAAIVAAAGAGRITHILLTHTHRDHSAGMAALKAATGAVTCGFGGQDERRTAANKHAEARAFLETSFVPDQRLADGDLVRNADVEVAALYTPGHAPDHLCFLHKASGVLFSGDHVMGWNTTVIAPPEGRMSDYLTSLQRLMEGDAAGATVFLAGHGEALHDPQRMVKAYLMHRQMRESMIFDAVRDGLGRVAEITDRVYRGLAPGMASAAKLSVLAHLEHLFERGLVACDGPPSLHRTFRPL